MKGLCKFWYTLKGFMYAAALVASFVAGILTFGLGLFIHETHSNERTEARETRSVRGKKAYSDIPRNKCGF